VLATLAVLGVLAVGLVVHLMQNGAGPAATADPTLGVTPDATIGDEFNPPPIAPVPADTPVVPGRNKQRPPRTATVPPPVTETPTTVVMPNVVGETLDSAQATLRAAGISDVTVQLRTTEDPSEDGTVLSQSVAAGTEVPQENAAVVLQVGQVVIIEPSPVN
jgi:PASTA domain